VELSIPRVDCENNGLVMYYFTKKNKKTIEVLFVCFRNGEDLKMNGFCVMKQIVNYEPERRESQDG
jgi:hypothetical protein